MLVKLPAHHRRSVFLLLIFTLVIFLPMLLHMILRRGADYQPHLLFALEMYEGTREIIPHPLFHFGVLLFYTVLPGSSIVQAGLLFSLLVYAALAYVLYRFYIRPVFGTRQNRTIAWVSIGFTLAVMLASAVTILTWPGQNLYRGYHLPNTYHSPTMAILRPLALLLFLYVLGVFSVQPYFKRWLAVFIAALLMVLTSLAKPNYTIAVVPVLVLVAGIQWLRRETVNWPLLVGGLLLPALVVIGIQTLMLPSSSIGGGRILVMPFGLTNFWREGDQWLLKLILSALFPLTVYGSYFQTARHDKAFNLAWLIFIVGVIFSYSFVEENRITDANFLWGGQITVFVLYAVTTTFFLQQIYDRDRGFQLDRRAYLNLLVFGLHLISGVLWYITEVNSTAIIERWW